MNRQEELERLLLLVKAANYLLTGAEESRVLQEAEETAHNYQCRTEVE